jgi:hypothetical protein
MPHSAATAPLVPLFVCGKPTQTTVQVPYKESLAAVYSGILQKEMEKDLVHESAKIFISGEDTEWRRSTGERGWTRDKEYTECAVFAVLSRADNGGGAPSMNVYEFTFAEEPKEPEDPDDIMLNIKVTKFAYQRKQEIEVKGVWMPPDAPCACNYHVQCGMPRDGVLFHDQNCSVLREKVGVDTWNRAAWKTQAVYEVTPAEETIGAEMRTRLERESVVFRKRLVLTTCLTSGCDSYLVCIGPSNLESKTLYPARDRKDVVVLYPRAEAEQR